MNLPQGLTRSFGRAVVQSKKQSPHIFFGLGLVGVVGSAIMACRATLKLEKIVDEIQEDFSAIHKKKQVSDKGGRSYDRDEYVRDLTFAYVRGAKKMLALYGPSVLVGGIGVASLAGAHVQLTRRNAALTAAFATVSKAYAEYRNRVRDEVGEEKELAIYQGCLLDDEEDIKNPKLLPLQKNGASPFSRYFEPSNVNWKADPEWNQIFLSCQQRYANDRLQAYGHVFLNEVYESMGFEHTKEGSIIGWVLGGDGDNHIDFGIFTPANVNFINHTSQGCLLDFNVDGVIYDKI